MESTNAFTINPLFKMALQKGVLIGVVIHVKRGEIETFDELGQTPLMLSAIYGHIDIFGYLLRSGANFHAKNNFGFSAIDLARLNKHEDLLDLWSVMFVENSNEKNYSINEQEINQENYGWEAEVTEIPEDDVSCRIQALNVQRRISMHEGGNAGRLTSRTSTPLLKKRQRSFYLNKKEFDSLEVKFKNDDELDVNDKKHHEFLGDVQVEVGEDSCIETKEKVFELTSDFSIEKVGAVFNVFKNLEKIAVAYSEDQLEKILTFHKAWKLNDSELNSIKGSCSVREVGAEFVMNPPVFRIEDRENKFLVFKDDSQVAAVYTYEQAEKIIKFHNGWKKK